MATKRMISLQIADTDAFLNMPATSQLLYFHLTIRADDEGFVDNPIKISRLIGVQSDDLKILIAKRFVLTFDNGVVVIKHWLIHNNIRMDRFNKTVYQDEKNSLTVKENKAYTELSTTRQPNGNQMATQVKLSKVKLSKVKLKLTPSQFAKSFFENFNTQEEVIKNLTKKHNANPAELRKEINNFILYWTEPNKSGTKVRWQLQPTFDITRRLITWFKRSNEFNNNKGIQSL